MENSAAYMRDERVVPVGLNSTVIAGPNGKRRRLTVYPISTNPVYVSTTFPPTVNGGAAVVQGTEPFSTRSDNQVMAICANGITNVLVVDEFDG